MDRVLCWIQTPQDCGWRRCNADARRRAVFARRRLGSDGYIYFAPTNIGGIWRVPEAGGTATEVTRKDYASGEISHRWPHLVAGSNMLLFAVWTGPGNDEHNVAIQEIGGKEHHILVKGGDAPRYVPKLGMLIYVRLGELFAVSWRPPNTDLGRSVPVAMYGTHKRSRRRRLWQLRRVRRRHAGLRCGRAQPQFRATSVDRPYRQGGTAALCRSGITRT